MATTTTRQPKPTRKGVPEPARRQAAWSGARASPTFSPGSSSPRLPNGPPAANQGGFPPLGQTNGTSRPQDNPHDRVLQSLSGLTGTTITLLTKTAQRYEGVIASTSGEGDMTGVTLKDVKEITNPGAPLKDSFFIASTNIDTWSSGPADAKAPNGDTFRTDTDISQKAAQRRDRELQAWQDPSAATAAAHLEQGDDLTFGPAAVNSSWDQFDVNEKLFGVKTNFDMDQYTTRLNRSAADFKEREREAQRIANEIMGTATNNPHIAEERNLAVDDSGVNEEDKYGAVVRGTNAYIPPGARKAGVTSPGATAKSDIPKVSIDAPEDAPESQTQSGTPPPKAPSPVPSSTNSNKPPADPLPAFRDFVTNERQRLTQKRQALVKSEMDKRMAELVKFSQSFKLNKPIPDDLVPILAKDEEKQKQIRDKSTKDAHSAQARNIGSSATTGSPSSTAANRVPVALQQSVAKLGSTSKPAPVASGAPKAVPAGAVAPAPKAVPAVGKTGEATKASATSKGTIPMFIQAIPPFKGGRPRPAANASSTVSTNGSAQSSMSGTSTTPAAPVPAPAPPPAAVLPPVSPTTAANRLNVNASSFRPNPKANAFSPVAPSPNPSAASASASASASPKPKPAEASRTSTPNPFFGTRVIKKNTPVHVKDDFNPFKHNKVVEANQVSAIWPYSGKRYMQMFPPLQHQPPQQSPHMAPPGPPPMPPPSYEEDSAAQAAARGYVYAYPPYAYPGQPMMPGMAPPGPPGAYMPGPFMQPMGYPPGMPPPNGQPMYASPNMGQMPPPQAYMPPPPPGTYPPPNGAGPRPSMPPTPIPTHAHPYYHQSPQLQHAVPYMMMAPPNGPPGHPYEGGGPAPPVPMGGVGHA